MNFSIQQQNIIKLLKTYTPFTLADIARKLGENKSTLLYHLDELVEQHILIKNQYSAKTITYELAPQEEIQEAIKSQTAFLEQLLTNKEIEGLDAYKELLNHVANGKNNTIGYGNIESKIIPEVEPLLEKFRDTYAASGRIDRFVVPDSPANIALLKDHFRKPEWKKAFQGRIISRDLMNVNCDIYVWDNSVGICSFEGNRFKVKIHTDKLTVETYRSLLEVLWNASEDSE